MSALVYISDCACGEKVVRSSRRKLLRAKIRHDLVVHRRIEWSTFRWGRP